MHWKLKFSTVFDWQRTGPVPFQLLHKDILPYETTSKVEIFELKKRQMKQKREN